MSGFSSPAATPAGMPIWEAASLARAVGVPKHFPTLAAFNTAVAANVADPLWSDNESMTVATEPIGVSRRWLSSLGHARTVVMGSATVVLIADSNTVYAANGAAPGNGVGAINDYAYDRPNAAYYAKTGASTWGASISVGGGGVTTVAGRSGAITLTNADIAGSAPLASPSFTGPLTTAGPILTPYSTIAALAIDVTKSSNLKVFTAAPTGPLTFSATPPDGTSLEVVVVNNASVSIAVTMPSAITRGAGLVAAVVGLDAGGATTIGYKWANGVAHSFGDPAGAPTAAQIALLQSDQAARNPNGVIDVSMAVTVPAAVNNAGSPTAVTTPVPQSDTGNAVAVALQSWATRMANNRRVVIGLPTGITYQTKAGIHFGNDSAVIGTVGGLFGTSGQITPQGDYPAVASQAYIGGTDSIRCVFSGFSINPTNLHNGANYAIDLLRQFFTDFHNIVVDPAATARVWRGLRIRDSDSCRFFNYRQTNCQGQQFFLGGGATNVNFFGGNFENGNGSVKSSIASRIDAYDTSGGSGIYATANTNWSRQAQVAFYGTQFERFGDLIVNAGYVTFDTVALTGTNLILGPRSLAVSVKNNQGIDANLFVLAPSNTVENVETLNSFMRSKKTLGENAALVHPNGSDTVYLAGGVEWFLWPEVYCPTIAAITVGAGSNAGNATLFAAEAARVDIKNAAGAVLETSPTYDLRKGGVSIGTTLRDGFAFMSLQKSTDAKLVLTPAATTGSAACLPFAWRNKLSNGMLAGYTTGTTTPPTTWVNNGAAITYTDGSVAGWVALASSGAAAMEQVVAMRPGRTYMAVARVKTNGALTMVFGRAANGADGRRHVYCSKNANVDPGFGDGSTILQCFVTCGSRSETATLSLGGTAALGGVGVDELKWVVLVDLDEAGILYSAGPPTTGTFEVGDVVQEVAPIGGGPSAYQCVTRGTAVVGNFRGVGFTAPSLGTTANRPTLATYHRGTQYLDSTLASAGKLITWSGTQWVDATGTVV